MKSFQRLRDRKNGVGLQRKLPRPSPFFPPSKTFRLLQNTAVQDVGIIQLKVVSLKNLDTIRQTSLFQESLKRSLVLQDSIAAPTSAPLHFS